jgi:hypothetical protein
MVALLAAAALLSGHPSERGCLLAWNAAANQHSRAALAGSGPWRSASLRTAVVGSLTWGNGTTTATQENACVLDVAGNKMSRELVGVWRNGGVLSWKKRGGGIGVRVANVRVLADGRVTKIYRR